MINKKTSNRLSSASSPYLLQHAHNPVDWYEWGDEALSKAKTENKPLIISIGYAACHWCHVMEHESFEDEEVAKLMNENFICIKVDREERPDIDQIYMDACMILNGNGGWPLNAFALPDGKPFYAGTYYPKPKWISVLSQLAMLYKKEYAKVEEQSLAITEGIKKSDFIETVDDTKEFTEADLKAVYSKWKPGIDFEHGGYGNAPKFPLPSGWEFLLEYNYFTKDRSALDAVQITLDKMALGGLYDQIGGGFTRYSVDKIWLVPHFEKMLYDNGQLINLYSNAYKVFKKPLYKDVVYETIDFAERELLSPEGGFYSSLNADSEGEEGKFYVWIYDEFIKLFNEDDGKLVAGFFNIKPEGNWEHKKNIPHVTIPKEGYATWNKLDSNEFNSIIKRAKVKLLDARSKRIRPSTDDKILTSWNALMLKGLINAYTAFGEQKFLDRAINNADFITEKMMQNDDSLFRNYKNDTASITAFLDDYALLTDAFISLYETTFDEQWLNKATKLTEYVRRHFFDEENQLFHYTSDTGEKLVARKKEISDNVIPSSNSVMAINLYKLSKLLDNSDYLFQAEKMLVRVKNQIINGGPYFSNWARLAVKFLYGTYEAAVTGKNAVKYNHDLQKHFIPDVMFTGSKTKSSLPLLQERYVEGKTLIYVCKNNTCQLPVESVDKALTQMHQSHESDLE